MDLYSALRNAYHTWKKVAQRNHTAPMSRVRRVDRVYPLLGKRVVAMTFDDGPTDAPARPYSSEGITRLILDAMKEYGARGTFDVIGSTQENYPDKAGRIGSFTWGGLRFDHYPEFGQDQLAGAANQPDLIRRILEEGHEISNHGYRHVAFGPRRVIYGSRTHFMTLAEVLEDLGRLHNLMRDSFGYAITLGRPPHYIDRIPDGRTSFDAYKILGYQYLGASFDGGGWRRSSGGPRKEVEKMVEPLRVALEEDPDSLVGQIVFEKDGYNMSLEAPVVEALPLKLALLKRYDYQVIPVRELLSISPYTDIGPDHEAFSAVQSLERMGLPVLYRDNTFRPDQVCKVSEMLAWLSCTFGESEGRESQDSNRGYKTQGNDRDDILTVGLLAKMVPQGAIAACRIQVRDKDKPVARWIAAMAATEALDLESISREDIPNG